MRPHSSLKKYSVRLSGHATSLSLEPLFWEELERIGTTLGRSRQNLIEEIDSARLGNLSSAIRLFVLQKVMERSAPPPSF